MSTAAAPTPSAMGCSSSRTSMTRGSTGSMAMRPSGRDHAGRGHCATPTWSSTPSRGRLIAVREDHTGDGEAVNTVVAARSRRRRGRRHGPRLRRRLLLQSSPQPGRQAAGLAAMASPQHAVGRLRAVGRSDRRGWSPDRHRARCRRTRGVDLPARMGARRHALLRLRPHRLVESLPAPAATSTSPWRRWRPSSACRRGSSA